jgi:hypothetical protein
MTVINYTNDTKYQGGGKREHNQQPSKGRDWITSAGLAKKHKKKCRPGYNQQLD